MMRAHTREKPFKCNLCNYASSASNQLQEHIRTHTVEIATNSIKLSYINLTSQDILGPTRLDRCTIWFCNIWCDNTFKREQELTIHFRTHLTSDWMSDSILNYMITPNLLRVILHYCEGCVLHKIVSLGSLQVFSLLSQIWRSAHRGSQGLSGTQCLVRPEFKSSQKGSKAQSVWFDLS